MQRSHSFLHTRASGALCGTALYGLALYGSALGSIALITSGCIEPVRDLGQAPITSVHDVQGTVDIHAAALDQDGSVAVVGAFEGSATIFGESLTSAGQQDGFVALIGPDQRVVRVISVGAEGTDRITAVVFGRNGEIYVAGITDSVGLGDNDGRPAVFAAEYAALQEPPLVPPVFTPLPLDGMGQPTLADLNVVAVAARPGVLDVFGGCAAGCSAQQAHASCNSQSDITQQDSPGFVWRINTAEMRCRQIGGVLLGEGISAGGARMGVGPLRAAALEQHAVSTLFEDQMGQHVLLGPPGGSSGEATPMLLADDGLNDAVLLGQYRGELAQVDAMSSPVPGDLGFLNASEGVFAAGIGTGAKGGPQYQWLNGTTAPATLTAAGFTSDNHVVAAGSYNGPQSIGQGPGAPHTDLPAGPHLQIMILNGKRGSLRNHYTMSYAGDQAPHVLAIGSIEEDLLLVGQLDATTSVNAFETIVQSNGGLFLVRWLAN